MGRMKKGPDIAILTGFGGTKGMEALEDPLKEKLQPRSFQLIPTAISEDSDRSIYKIADAANSRLHAINSDDLLLIGGSFGALVALMLGCRQWLAKVSNLILIDGPLRSDVLVEPAHPKHAEMFQHHYDIRKMIARNCENVLAETNSLCSKIVTIGSKHDDIVPPDAKFLTGDFTTLELGDDGDVHDGMFSVSTGYNVVLPDNYRGHSFRKRTPIVTDIICHAYRTQVARAA